MQSLRDIAVKLAWHYVGRPYRWGGDDPEVGFDCSGLIVELLQASGIITGDYTANAMMHMFKKYEVPYPYPGCLVFFGYDDRASHVEFCINDMQTIGASGGGRSTLSLKAAVEQNAFIKVRPINRRDDLIRIVDPFKEVER